MDSKLNSLFIAAILALVGCGGGSSETASTTSAPSSVSTLPTSFACGEASAFGKAEKITVDSTKLASQFPSDQVISFETWNVKIDGSAFRLNVRVAMPKAGIPIRGVWLYSHGIANYSAAPKESIDYDGVHESHATSLGYITMSVARRGNFGSEGTPSSPNRNTWVAQYQSRQINYSQLDDLQWGYHADSVIAAIEYMKTDTRIGPYLHTIVLQVSQGALRRCCMRLLKAQFSWLPVTKR